MKVSDRVYNSCALSCTSPSPSSPSRSRPRSLPCSHPRPCSHLHYCSRFRPRSHLRSHPRSHPRSQFHSHNYSGGAGRASPTTGTGYGITAVGAAAAAEYPSTAEELRQNHYGQLTTSTGDQTSQLAWVQRPTCIAGKLKILISHV